jgi:uncharacterized protein with GYD domain
MTLFVLQGRYTLPAIKGLVKNPHDREPAVRKLIESVGGKLHSYYITFGESDFLIVFEAPSEADALSAVAIAAAAEGATDTRLSVAISTKDAVRAFEKAGKVSGQYKPAGG